jgi:acetyltransferase-like isoleucine patch superfamily enzyme
MKPVITFLIEILTIQWINKLIENLRMIYCFSIVNLLSKKYGCKINFIIQGSGGLSIDCYKSDKKKLFFIDKTSHLKSGAYIECSGGVFIGKYFHTGRNLTIMTTNHNFKSKEYIPYGIDNIEKRVQIDNYVWCGANVIILPGVHIGEGAILGAGSVIRENVPSCAIVFGNPASVVKYRDIETFHKLKKEGKVL